MITENTVMLIFFIILGIYSLNSYLEDKKLTIYNFHKKNNRC